MKKEMCIQEMKRNRAASAKTIALLTALLLFNVSAFASVENLDESASRSVRHSTATYSNTLLENSSTGIWQPETLFYSDATTSNEVWKFTNTPVEPNTTQDIANPQWSANGKWISFASKRVTAKFNTYGAKIWMLSNTDGSKLQPAYAASSRSANWIPYFNWNPARSDIFYATGSGSTAEGTDVKSIYSHSLDANGVITKNKILTVSSATSTRLSAKKSIAPDGSRLYFKDTTSGGTQSWVANLTGTPFFETPNTGYNNKLNFDLYWGGTVSWAGYHDQFVSGASRGADGLYFFVMPETSNSDGPWWRTRLTGKGTDSAPIHVQNRTAPAWGEEIEPLSTVTTSEDKADPWRLDGDPNTNSHYLSHFAPDRWGRYIINAKAAQPPIGVNIWDTRKKDDVVTFTSVPHSQHHDWSAWSDWAINSGSTVPNDNYPTFRINTQNYKDPGSQKTLAFTHTRYNATVPTTYDSLPRPSQSPDGTKAMFHSTFLNATDNAIQLFWTVAYYPYPPEIKGAVKEGNNVRLTWDFNQGALCSSDSQATPRTGPTPNLTTTRTYATRGWPHETLDCPPSPREIDKFRVWVSSDNSTWTPLGTTTYNNCRGTNECGMWTETSWAYDAVQQNNTIRYYAITSLEYSGLESRTLSNVWKVELGADGNITQQDQETIYPSDPGGKSSFYTTRPASPTDVQFVHKLTPAIANGQYTISWKAPTINNLIRYYNIYAKDKDFPSPIQQSRIASIPASSDYSKTGIFKYIDWLGATDGSTKYIVTSVDYQGNESLVTPIGTPKSPAGAKGGWLPE